jgi:hypothetical protein
MRNLSYFDPQVPGTSFSFSSYRKAWFYSHTASFSLSQPLKDKLLLNAGYTFKSILSGMSSKKGIPMFIGEAEVLKPANGAR